jgi:ankyrin repeat protein
MNQHSHYISKFIFLLSITSLVASKKHDPFAGNPITGAARTNDTEKLKEYLKNKQDIYHVVDHYGHTALIAAAMSNSPDTFRMLLPH